MSRKITKETHSLCFRDEKLVFDPNDGKMYMINHKDNCLVKVDVDEALVIEFNLLPLFQAMVNESPQSATNTSAQASSSFQRSSSSQSTSSTRFVQTSSQKINEPIPSTSQCSSFELTSSFRNSKFLNKSQKSCQQKQNINANISEDDDEDDDVGAREIENKRAYWTHAALLSLINLYRLNKVHFDSTKTRQSEVWQKVEKAMKEKKFEYSWKQCRDKFKNLKMDYHTKLDNMNPNKNTGAARFDFKYFDELDEIFGKEPTANPVSIVSPKRPLMEITNRPGQPGPLTNQSGGKKKRLTPTDIYARDIDNQARRQLRHDDRMRERTAMREEIKRSNDLLEQQMNKNKFFIGISDTF